MKSLPLVVAAALVIAPAATVSTAPSADARPTSVVAKKKPVRPATKRAPLARRYASCAALNRVYPHGVGVPGAVDRTKSASKKFRPVTNFTRNAAVYKVNAKRLDADRDGIACEKH